MELFNGQASTEVLSDLSDESIYESQTEETPQEEPIQEASEEEQAEPVNEESTSSEEEEQVDWKAKFEEERARSEKIDQSYRALRTDYNARNTANNARIAELEKQLGEVQKAEPTPLDPELSKVLEPYLKPYQDALAGLKNEIAGEREQAIRKAQDEQVNAVVSGLKEKFPEVSNDEAISNVIAEAVKISTQKNNPNLYREYPDLVFNLAAENLYGKARIEAAGKAAAAAAEQARAATLKEQAAKEAGKVGLEAATQKNKSDVPPAETDEERIQREISAVRSGGLFR